MPNHRKAVLVCEKQAHGLFTVNVLTAIAKHEAVDLHSW